MQYVITIFLVGCPVDNIVNNMILTYNPSLTWRGVKRSWLGWQPLGLEQCKLPTSTSLTLLLLLCLYLEVRQTVIVPTWGGME